MGVPGHRGVVVGVGGLRVRVRARPALLRGVNVPLVSARVVAGEGHLHDPPAAGDRLSSPAQPPQPLLLLPPLLLQLLPDGGGLAKLVLADLLFLSFVVFVVLLLVIAAVVVGQRTLPEGRQITLE